MDQITETWECADPMAWLVRCHKKLRGDEAKALLARLDLGGWCNESGRPDVARAEREFVRVANGQRQSDGGAEDLF